jgi:hypothetical protein
MASGRTFVDRSPCAHDARVVHDLDRASRDREDRINVRVAELIGMQRCIRQPVVTVKAKLLGLIERRRAPET